MNTLPLTSFFLVFLLAAGPLSAENAQALADRLVLAFNAGDTAAIEADCEKAFWASDDGPGNELIREGYGSGSRQWWMKLSGLEEAPGRAAATVTLVNASTDRPVDELFFYAEERDGRWRWTGANEDKGFRRGFLAGVIDGAFDPAGLPSDPELEALAERLEPFLALVGGRNYTLETRWHEGTQRGALVVNGPPDETGAQETAVLYVHRTDRGWVLVRSSYGLWASSFLDF